MFSLPIVKILTSFCIAALITWFIIPKIVKVAAIKRLTDKPGPRKVHATAIPALGGIGIFSGFFISLMIVVNGNIKHLSVMAAAVMIIFLVGAKDDLINISPTKKLIAEVIAALLVTVGAGLRMTSLYGIFGISELPYVISIALSVLVIVLVMNSFNLVDGIDGLAASIGILASAVYGVWFWLAGETGYAIMAAALTGAICAFLPYNMSKGRFKMFMGDTGSLIIGFLLAIFTIRFNELNTTGTIEFAFYSAPAVALGILFLPLFDTFRVTIIRLRQGLKPFHGDNNHLHHRLLRLGCSHGRATLILTFINALYISIPVFFDLLGTLTLMLIMIVSAIVFSFLSLKLEKEVALHREIETNVRRIIELIPKDKVVMESRLRVASKSLTN